MISERRIEFLLRDLQEAKSALSNKQLYQFECLIRDERNIRLRQNTYF